MSRDLLNEISRYYADKLFEHGCTPRGVDWKDSSGQLCRFRQLCNLLPHEGGEFSLLDLGCGWGGMLPYLKQKGFRCTYLGVDISPPMIAAARSLHAGHRDARFETDIPLGCKVDYAFASGVFNVRLSAPDAHWFEHVLETLDTLERSSKRGFAFNLLSAFADPERKRPDLFYAEPGKIFETCVSRYSRDVALLHDYGLFEFTILVRKPA